jgi:iron(III) transport system substrate-binding protein
MLHIKDIDGSVYQEKVKPGIFINYYPADICAHIDPKYRQYAMPMYIELFQWFYNTELNSAPPISSWWDLTKPEWKGRIMFLHPLTNMDYLATYTGFVQYTDEFAADYQRVFGEPIKLSPECPTAVHELLKRMLANDLIFGTSGDICEAVGTPGLTSAPIGYAGSNQLRKNQTDGWVLEPIQITPATSLTNQNNLYIVNECLHPNAAKLFLRWMLGEADGRGPGFTPFNTLGGWPVRDDVAPEEGSAPLTSIKFWAGDPAFIYDYTPEFKDFWISVQDQ